MKLKRNYGGIKVICETLDRETKQWLPGQILEPSILNNVFWVKIYYPDGAILERSRNISEIRKIS